MVGGFELRVAHRVPRALVALADALWKGHRSEKLEAEAVNLLTARTTQRQWEVFQKLDNIFEAVAANGDDRLTWQRSK